MRCHGEAARSVLAKVGDDVFILCHAVSKNFAVEPRIYSLACWDKFFMYNTLDVKESDDHALEIVFTCLAFFGLCDVGLFH